MAESEMALPKDDIRDLRWLELNPRSWARAMADPDICRWERYGLIEFLPAVGCLTAGWAITTKGSAAIRQDNPNET